MEAVKTVLVGESGVGKTSIISRFITDSFDPEVLSSSSAQFISKTIKLEETTIKFDIWDTAGQEKFRSLAKIFYKDAKIIIYVYDITDKNSFEEIKNYWYKETLDNITNKDVILALIGNKTDLYENEQVSDEEGKKFAKQINAIFKTTSALSNIGINWLFENLGKKVLDPNYDYTVDEKIQMQSIQKNASNNNNNNNIKLNNSDNKTNNKDKKCC
jgi:small GTP-binding protein